ncbi:hypothetical protein ABZ307_28395 [Streptomyces griseorubiginosus]|uniref:hypothetical protein n=1 Tax=Streptomyces griseorubiginosus TaxID=67304 RepID=UPI0033BAC89A
MKKTMTWARWKQLLNASMPVALDVNGAILIAVGVSLIYGSAGVIVGGIASLIMAKHYFGGG